MRNNGPVTQNEVYMSDGSMIVSITDDKGRIKFVNKDFIDISGFVKEELIGQPHNIIRHMDMPPEAFADLWRDLKAGLPWSGYVKNRVKNGDHYWVHANAMPIMEHGVVTGYVSIRNKPDADTVRAVSDIYRKFQNGNAGTLSIEHGQVIDQSRKARLRRWLGRTSNKMLVNSATLWAILFANVALSAVFTSSANQNLLLAVNLGSLLAAGVIAFMLTRHAKANLRGRLDHIDKVLMSIANGNFKTAIDQGTDEFQTILARVNALQNKLAFTDYEKAELEREKHEVQERLAKDFEHTIKSIVNIVAAAVTELSQTAEGLVGTANESAHKATNASDAAASTTANVQSVAAASEELSATVREISAQLQITNQLVCASQEKAHNADQVANALNAAVNKVSSAMEMIANIAGQINMLALNATIESARAGDAGKGFAVVANEVKDLANQANKTTEQIQQVVEEMRCASQDIIGALKDIGGSVGSISEATSGVASAVEEQSATTGEISHNMQKAASSTQSIADSLHDVQAASAHAGSASEQMLIASKELSRQAEELNLQVDNFLQRVRAA